MLNIKGIPSEQEALSLYDAWKKEREDWNREAKIHDSILVWVVILLCVLAAIGIAWSSGWDCKTDALGPLRILGLCLIPIVGFFIIAANFKGQWEFNDFSLPLKCKYYEKTHGKNILETRLDDDVLCFVLENDKHEVETACLAGFRKKCRTDIDEVVVDLNNAEILLPYKKSEK